MLRKQIEINSKFFLSEKQANSVLEMPLKIDKSRKNQIDDNIKFARKRIIFKNCLMKENYYLRY